MIQDQTPWEPTFWREKNGEKNGSQMPPFFASMPDRHRSSVVDSEKKSLVNDRIRMFFMVCDMKSPISIGYWAISIPYAYIKLPTGWFRNSWFRPQMFAHWFRMEFTMRFYLESSTPQQLHHTKEKMQFPKPLVNPTAVYMPCTYILLE